VDISFLFFLFFLRNKNTFLSRQEVPNYFNSSVCLVNLFFANLFYCSVYFCYYSWILLHFLILFIGLIVLFQLTFTFIYSTFNKKFLILAK